MSMVGTVIRLPDEEVREMLASPEDVRDMIISGDHPEVDVDKAWDAIRYLLQRLYPDEPLAGFLLEGGLPVGDDLGYGPGHAYLSQDVGRIASLLASTTSEDLRRVFDPVDMTKSVYPGIWDRDLARDDTFDYVDTRFSDLKAFVSESLGSAIVAWIS